MINHIYQLVSPHFLSVSYADVNLNEGVIVRPDFMSICHADQRYYLGTRDAKVLSKKLPMALIHEYSGTVLRDNTKTFRVGQKVVLIPNIPGEKCDGVFENYSLDSKFRSSSIDGFMQELVSMPADRLVVFENIKMEVAAICEFVSVACHAVNRFKLATSKKIGTIGIWGDGSLAYVLSCVLKEELPDSKVVVIGKDVRKLSYFTFVDRTFLVGSLLKDFSVDNAFECAGGEGSFFAIDDIIRFIRPQGYAVLLGVSENKISINTRDILEKGLTFIGCSRSGREDFEKAINLMEKSDFQSRLSAVISQEPEVKEISDIHRVFKKDSYNLFKTVFKWGV